MTDLLDELRALNPVDRDALDVPPAVAADVLGAPPPQRRSRRLRWAVMTAAAVAALVGVAVLIPGRGTPDLASRAYAAITGPGVVHWRTEIVNFADGRPTVRQRQEGWAAGGVQHIVDYDLPHGRPRLGTDTVITRDRQTSYSPASDHVFTGPAPKLATSGGVVYGDPMEAFRLAKRAGELVPDGPHRYRVDPSRLPGAGDRVDQTWTYVLDPRTARPTALVVRSTSARASTRRYRTEFRFAVYDRLPDTAENRAHLRALPRPAPSLADPAAFFGVLRTGTRPTPAQRAAARLLVAHGPFALELSRAHATGPALVIPGRNAICVQIDGGGACNGLRPTVRHGLAFSGSRTGAWMLVPDGVASVRARLPRHPWQTFPVHHNIVHLPNGGYHAAFTPPARLLDKLG
jgi:hypothetical protein